jgi:poly(A) polymerase
VVAIHRVVPPRDGADATDADLPHGSLEIAQELERVAQGPALGAAIAAAEQAWILAGFPGDQAALDAIAAEAVGAIAPQK